MNSTEMFNLVVSYILGQGEGEQMSWNDRNCPQQAKALFTSYCLLCDEEVDSANSDQLLETMYAVLFRSAFPVLPFEDFKDFMVANLV